MSIHNFEEDRCHCIYDPCACIYVVELFSFHSPSFVLVCVFVACHFTRSYNVCLLLDDEPSTSTGSRRRPESAIDSHAFDVVKLPDNLTVNEEVQLLFEPSFVLLDRVPDIAVKKKIPLKRFLKTSEDRLKKMRRARKQPRTSMRADNVMNALYPPDPVLPKANEKVKRSPMSCTYSKSHTMLPDLTCLRLKFPKIDLLRCDDPSFCAGTAPVNGLPSGSATQAATPPRPSEITPGASPKTLESDSESSAFKPAVDTKKKNLPPIRMPRHSQLDNPPTPSKSPRKGPPTPRRLTCPFNFVCTNCGSFSSLSQQVMGDHLRRCVNGTNGRIRMDDLLAMSQSRAHLARMLPFV